METVQTEQKFYQAGSATPRGGSTSVLKHGDTFGIYDQYGDVEQTGVGEQGSTTRAPATCLICVCRWAAAILCCLIPRSSATTSR